jgi:hypothetical protein
MEHMAFLFLQWLSCSIFSDTYGLTVVSRLLCAEICLMQKQLLVERG